MGEPDVSLFFFFIYFYNPDQIIGEYMNVSHREGDAARGGGGFLSQPVTCCNVEHSTKKNIFLFLNKAL